jgi:ribonuclease P protein component
MDNPSKKFPKSSRLTSQISVKESFEKGKLVRTPGIKAYFRKNSSSSCKVLISVPKRLHKRAVVRNLIKRRIREAYRLNINLLNGLSPVDLVLIYSTKEILEYAQIKILITYVLEKIRKGLDEDIVTSLSTAD